MVKTTLNSRRKSTTGPAIKIPDIFSVPVCRRGPVKPPPNTATKKIINNFYHLTHEATQTQQRRQTKPIASTHVDKTTSTDDLRARTRSAYEPSEDARLFIRVKRSLLLKLVNRIKEQSAQLDEVRKRMKFSHRKD